MITIRDNDFYHSLSTLGDIFVRTFGYEFTSDRFDFEKFKVSLPELVCSIFSICQNEHSDYVRKNLKICYTPEEIRDFIQKYGMGTCEDYENSLFKDDPRQHKAKRVGIVVEYMNSSLERYIKDHTNSEGNLKPKSVTLSPEYIGKTITCSGCKDNIPYGKPFSHYGKSVYCSKKCCSDHICDGDDFKLFESSPDKSLEEYDRTFVRYYGKE